MPTINYATIIDDFIKDGFFSEYLPPVFSMRNRFDPCCTFVNDVRPKS